ncbi:hypothetical protein ACPPVO_17690 [Dactylosporangium sp. McL0621]|uniref:hypothetical protein n=1 Tax=Dactylosporangium sp. McL0621 TaxID=3415678 RepID=UPI003CF26E13
MSDSGDGEPAPAGRTGTKPGLGPGIRIGLVVLSAVLIAVAVIGGPTTAAAWMRWTARLAAAGVLAGIGLWFTRKHYMGPRLESHQTTRIWKLPDRQVYILQRSAGKRAGARSGLTAQQVKAFTLAVVAPAEVRERITERYEPGQRTLTQRVTIESHLTIAPPGNGGTVLFPVLMPRKGELVDNLRVMDGTGADLPVLSYRQYLQLVALSLRTLLDVAHGTAIDPDKHAEAIAAEHRALKGIMYRGRARRPSSGEALRRLTDQGDQQPLLSNPAAIDMAVALADGLASHYAVVVAVPWPADGRFIVTYERLITPTLVLARARGEGVLNWFKGRARLLLDASPVDISIPLENAFTSQSYHLIVDAQEGVYLGSHSAPGLVEYCTAHARRAKRTWRNGGPQPPPPPYFRFRRRAGQRYAHFYTRFFPGPVPDLKNGDVLPEVRFRFYEVPPGSVFRAAVAAIAATILIWLVGFVASRKPDPGTDVPAFLLVFPAVAAAWLGYEAGSARRLLEGTLAARLSLVFTALASVAGSGLFMVYKSQLAYLHWPNPYHLEVLGNASLAWSVLTLVSGLNAVFAGSLYLMRSWEYVHFSASRDLFTAHKEHGG